MHEIRELCGHCDILLLQETWLTEADLPLLSQISTDFYSRGITSMNTSTEVLKGRPFGGIAILWRKTLGPSAKPVLYDDNRLLGLELTTSNNVKLLVVNTYLPCSSAANLDEFIFYLSKLNSIIETADTNYCMVMGDFNADTSNDDNGNISQLFGKRLLSYSQLEDLTISDHLILDSRSTYTFVSAVNGMTSWLDHVVCTSSMHSLITEINVDYSYVTSDHLPMVVALDVNLGLVALNEQISSSPGTTISWDKLTMEDTELYSSLTEEYLGKIKLNHALILCDNPHCTDAAHIAAVDRMYNEIINALQDASTELQENSGKKHKSQILG